VRISEDRQPQVTSSQPIPHTETPAASTPSSTEETVSGNILTTHPYLRDSCGLYTILHRGQTAAGNILTTHPSHRDSCGLYTISQRGQTVTGNILTTHPYLKDSCGLYTILYRGQTTAGKNNPGPSNPLTPAASTQSSAEDRQHQVKINSGLSNQLTPVASTPSSREDRQPQVRPKPTELQSDTPAAVAEPSPANLRCIQEDAYRTEPPDGNPWRHRSTCRHTGRQPSGSEAKGCNHPPIPH
jgi:hypothetical protein